MSPPSLSKIASAAPVQHVQKLLRFTLLKTTVFTRLTHDDKRSHNNSHVHISKWSYLHIWFEILAMTN